MTIRGLLFAGAVTFCAALPAHAQDLAIAGLTPDARPLNAPTIQEVSRNESWYYRALTGVLAPYPASLRFLEDQGNWFTPFIHPGMTGPYDIRGWHSKE